MLDPGRLRLCLLVATAFTFGGADRASVQAGSPSATPPHAVQAAPSPSLVHIASLPGDAGATAAKMYGGTPVDVLTYRR